MKVQIWLLFLGCLRGVSLPDSVDRCNWNIHGGCPDRDNLAWDCLAESKECPPGQQYHCTRRIDNPTEYIDGCAVSKICLAGEAPYLVKDNLVQCSDCHSKEFFNSAESMNSSMYSECTFKAECDREVGVECNPIDPNSTDIYKYDRQCRCPARENYVFAHGREDSHKMCRSSDDVMGSFRCRKVAPCPSGEERLLNYTCGPKCAEGHRTNTSDECVPPFPTSNTMTAKTNTPIYSSKLTSKISSAASSPPSSSPPSTSTTTTTPTTTTTTTITPETWIAIGLLAGFVAIIGLVLYCCREMIMAKCRTRNNDQGRSQDDGKYRGINFEVTDEDKHGLNSDQLDRMATLMIQDRPYFLDLMDLETKNILDYFPLIKDFMLKRVLSSLRNKANGDLMDANRDILDFISKGGFYKYIHFKKILIHLMPHKRQELSEREMKVVDEIRSQRDASADDATVPLLPLNEVPSGGDKVNPTGCLITSV